ncbi:hypothetical protein ABZ454_36585 [Streptomyces sp. NPDC005803]|uniref:hypothetical protein n=1 Tax=Streptomyces sp. NPDC005803 TaxID=3154297 RepID=UPI0033F8A463
MDGDVLWETLWSRLEGGRTDGTELLVEHRPDEFRLFSVMAGWYGTATGEDGGTPLALDAGSRNDSDWWCSRR